MVVVLGGSPRSRPGRLALALISVLVAGLVGPAARADTPQVAARAPGWVGSWGGSAMAPSSLVSSVQTLDDQTVRNIVHTSAGGDALRVRLSNAFGDRTIRVGTASVARQLTGAEVDPATVRPITFRGRTGVEIPQGGSVLSDPVRMTVPARANLAVSLYVPEETGPATYHQDPQQDSYLAEGDHARDTGAGAFGTTLRTWFLVDAIQVRGPARGTIVAVGDSITDGGQGQWGANTRWPDFLARRLAERYGQAAPGVVNAGISGNRVLNDSGCFGPRLLDRLERDVFSHPGVRAVVLFEGINDLGFSQVTGSDCVLPSTDISVAELTAGYRRVIDAAHARGVRIYGVTLAPAEDSGYWDDAAEAKRRQVNDWIRAGNGFDGVVDVAEVLAYPGRPEILDPQYDSGDHLHPNDSGYQAIGDAVYATLTARR